MKKILSLILASVLVLSLAACSSTSGNSSSTGSQSSESSSGSSQEEANFEDELGNPGTIRVGISPDYKPFEYYDEAGNITGFDYEMVNELMKYIGTEEEPYPVEFIPMDFSTIISAVNTGTVDIGVAAFTYDPARDCSFSEPYYDSSQVIIVNKTNGIEKEEDLAGASMAAGMGTSGAGVVESLAEKYEGIKLVHPGDYTVMFESLKAGAISAVVCDKAVGMSYVEANPDVYVALEGEYDVQEMSVITAKKSTALMETINKAIEKFLESEEKQALVEKYDL